MIRLVMENFKTLLIKKQCYIKTQNFQKKTYCLKLSDKETEVVFVIVFIF